MWRVFFSNYDPIFLMFSCWNRANVVFHSLHSATTVATDAHATATAAHGTVRILRELLLELANHLRLLNFLGCWQPLGALLIVKLHNAHIKKP